MARYFCDVIDGRTINDEVGIDLPDLAAVRREAMRLLPEIARDEIHKEDGDVQTLALMPGPPPPGCLRHPVSGRSPR